MRAYAGIFIIISLLFLIGTVGAAIQVDVTGNSSWLIAGSGSSAAYTVTMTDSISGLPIQGAAVTFSVDPAYGTMSPAAPASVTTNSAGQAVGTFTVNTKSGTARIFANSSSPSLSIPIIQNIDHGILTPKFTPTTGTIGQVVPFTVSITDPWGNPIDNRRSDDTVSLTLTCPLPNDCSFEGYGHSFSSQPDSNGNITKNATLGTKTGLNSIVMSPVQDLGEQYAFINAAAGSPVSLTAEISPAPGVYPVPTVPFGTGVVYFAYTLLDNFDNPVENQLINVNTTRGESFSTTTDSWGKTTTLTYGPLSVLGNITINAIAVNSGLTNQFTVAVIAAEPKDMVLSVMPQTMASLDTNSNSRADVVVRVVDNFGNPVIGQDVTFTIACAPASTWSANPYLSTPYLNTYAGTTASDGTVKTLFIPGSLNAPNIGGNCTLTANWTSKPSYPPKTIQVTWMNYPYLSIYTEVSNTSVVLNDYINVTIRAEGNGKLNDFLPVTLMLDHDTTANMFSNSAKATFLNGTECSRGEMAVEAAVNFMYLMDRNNTKAGLEVFGQDKNTWHLNILPLSDVTNYNFNTFIDTLNDLGKIGGSGPNIALSIDRSITKIIGAANPGDVKALVVLSDGGTNIGDVSAVTNRANANNITIFTISYINENGNCPASCDIMEELAQDTHGKWYNASSAQDLKAVYSDIVHQIQKLASHNTTMAVSFQNISVNSSYAFNGADVYDYTPLNYGDSSPYSRTTMYWSKNNTRIFKDQTSEWPQLKFDIGSIDIGQNWSTTFRLKVKQPGLIKVFGNDSTISFNNGVSNLTLPDLFVNVYPNSTGGINTGTVNIIGLQTVPPGGSFTDFVHMHWNTNYTSSNSMNRATEKISYSINGGPWIQFDLIGEIQPGESPQSTLLDVRNFPKGTYTIKVYATEPFGATDSKTLSIVIGSANPYFIKLQ